MLSTWLLIAVFAAAIMAVGAWMSGGQVVVEGPVETNAKNPRRSADHKVPCFSLGFINREAPDLWSGTS